MSTAVGSPLASLRLSRSGYLRRPRRRVGARVRLADGSEFVVFRDTTVVAPVVRPALLEVRFHLRFTRPGQRRLHRLFQAVCIVTTPFFAGLPGYRTKLWMYDGRSGDYAGLYQWDGAERAEAYARALVRILAPLSAAGSVAYRVRPGERLAAR